MLGIPTTPYRSSLLSTNKENLILALKIVDNVNSDYVGPPTLKYTIDDFVASEDQKCPAITYSSIIFCFWIVR